LRGQQKLKNKIKKINKKNMLYRVYIGANNNTHHVEENKLQEVLNKYYEGYTIIQSTGYWHGAKEDSRIIEIDTTNRDQVLQAIQELKAVLQQEAIGLIEIDQSMQFI